MFRSAQKSIHAKTKRINGRFPFAHSFQLILLTIILFIYLLYIIPLCRIFTVLYGKNLHSNLHITRMYILFVRELVSLDILVLFRIYIFHEHS